MNFEIYKITESPTHVQVPSAADKISIQLPTSSLTLAHMLDFTLLISHTC